MTNFANIKIADIIIGERFRKDMGDLAKLSEGIKHIGRLLHPIGVSLENELIFGCRRLLACRDHLGWTEITAHIIDVNSIADGILGGEYIENEERKDLTTSERVAIKKALDERIKRRQGKRTDILPLNSTEVKIPIKPGEETRDAIARAADLGGWKTAEDAEAVIDNGTPELVDAMDKGEVKVSAAAAIATKPAEEQRRVVALPKKERKAVVRAIRAGAGKPQQPRNGKRLNKAMPKTDSVRLAIRPTVEAGETVNRGEWAEQLNVSEATIQRAELQELVRRDMLLELEELGLIDEYEKRKAPAKTGPRKRIDPPMQFPNLPTNDEIGAPPPGASAEEQLAWRDKMGAKTVMFVPRIKQLMTDEANINQAAHVIRITTRDDMPSAERFAKGVERMLAHVIKPNADAAGDRRDFAKIARDAQRTIEQNLEAAIAKLEAYRAIVRKQEEMEVAGK